MILHNKIEDAVIEVEETEETFNTWINKDFVPQNVQSQLKQANLLIVPEEQVSDISGPVFPKSTEHLWLQLQKSTPAGVRADICVGEEYEEYAFHGELLIIAQFVAEYVVAPLVVSWLYDYIKSKAKKENDDTEVRFEMTITAKGQGSKKVKYRGPANQFEKLIEKVNEVSGQAEDKTKKIEKK